MITGTMKSAFSKVPQDINLLHAVVGIFPTYSTEESSAQLKMSIHWCDIGWTLEE